MIDAIKKKAAELSEKVIGYRRHLHAHPELSFKEYQTSIFIKERLDEMNIPWVAAAGTGVMASIKGKKDTGKVVVLRADMDALPITEVNQVDYCSTNPGVMHACGHDFHTASLLGTAEILNSFRDEIEGEIKLLFQPAEELMPGGAQQIIKEGFLENPVPHAVIGQHVSPFLEAGKIAIRKGKFMASMDELFIKVYGRGGHGAQPHNNVDPVMIAAQILVALQQVVSRNANPALPTVLSIGKVIANGAINVIPDEVYMEGTFRTLDENWRDDAHQIIKKIASGIAESMGGSCEVLINRGYPFLVNDDSTTESVIKSAGSYLGANLIGEAGIWMAAEDFARYSQIAPSCFYLIGTGNHSCGITSSLHSATFDVDESVLERSMGLMAWVGMRMVGRTSRII